MAKSLDAKKAAKRNRRERHERLNKLNGWVSLLEQQLKLGRTSLQGRSGQYDTESLLKAARHQSRELSAKLYGKAGQFAPAA